MLNGLQNGFNATVSPCLTYVSATEKRFDFVQRGVNKEMPHYSYKTPRKRKPPDKICFIIRGLG